MVRLAGAALAVALATAATGCAAAGSSSSPPLAHHSATPTRATSRATVARHPVGVLGSFRVGQHWLRFTEPSHRGVTGTWLTSRQLLVQALYPAAARRTSATAAQPARGPFPMIMFAPGFLECGAPYGPMLRSWASAGYVVVVVNFPKSDCRVGAAATESDMVNQPGDLSFVISRMLALDARRSGPFAGLIERRAIAAAGQSDGGDTVAALAANTCCADRRVVAVAALSGAEWPPMPGRYFTRAPVPMLVTQGSADQINWPGCSVQLYLADPARARYYLDLFGASHTGPYWGVDQFERVVVRVGLAFFDRFVLGQAAAGRAMQRDGNVPNVAVVYRHGAGHLKPGPCDN